MAWILPVSIIASGVISSYMSKKASDKATAAQLQGADRAADVQLEMFYQARADLEPWREAGGWALEKLRGRQTYATEEPKREDYTTTRRERTGTRTGPRGAERPVIEDVEAFDETAYNKALADWEETGTYEPGLIEQGPGEFKESPGYQFRLGEGLKAIERRGAARGGAQSPSTSMALMEYGQGFASNEYDKFLGRYYQSLTPYQSMAGQGMTSAGQTGMMGTQTGANLANIYQGAGQAQAAGYIREGNIYGNMFQQGTNLAAQYYMYNKAGMFNQTPQTQGLSGNLYQGAPLA